MVDDVRYNRAVGLESFFTRGARPGPRWRMTALTIVAVFAITTVLQQFVMPHLARWPLEARLVLSATVVVIAMGHVVMPALTRLFARWLHPSRD
jgi:antibiotic biosynthesis monooxygenase (ABM) superfamily enzyme